MNKNFFVIPISLLTFLKVNGEMRANFSSSYFRCPEKGAKSIEPYESEVLSCTELSLVCAKTHENNEPILKAIRSLSSRCAVSSITPTILEGSQEIVLSVLEEDVAKNLLELQLCSVIDGEVSFDSKKGIRNYTRIAGRDMFFKKIACLQSFVKEILGDFFINFIRERLGEEGHESQIFHEKLLGFYPLKMFQGILSTKEPFLLAEHFERLIDQIYLASDSNSQKAVEYIIKMMEGPYDEPLRSELDSDGTYKDYNNSDENFVHICQSVRQNFYPGLMDAKNKVSKLGQELEAIQQRDKLEIKHRLIIFCDQHIDTRSYFEKAYLPFLILVLLIIFIAAYMNCVIDSKKVKHKHELEDYEHSVYEHQLQAGNKI